MSFEDGRAYIESLEDEHYLDEVAAFIKQKEDEMEEQKQKNEDAYYASYEPVSKEHKKLSRGTRAQRERKDNKMKNLAQAVLTGTLDQTKKNTKKYKNSIVGQVFVDALPQYVKTLSKRREHRKREINLARSSKIDANTACPTPSEQREWKDVESEAEYDFWHNIQMQEIEQRQESWDDIDRREHRYVGEMLAREHLANVNDCYDCYY
jgi:hypothetical protein